MKGAYGQYGAWSDQAAQRLRTLWLDGQSAAQIAKTLAAENLGVFTRSAICGKVNRLGLAGRVSAPRAAKRVPRPKTSRTPNLPRAPRIPASVLRERAEVLGPLAAEGGVPLAPNVLMLQRGQCKWPIGDPAAASFAFCARPATLDADPYCDCHRALARVAGSAWIKPGKRKAAA